MSEMSVEGVVVRFDQAKGYGFISPDGGGEDVFLHVNELLGPKYLMSAGRRVSYVPVDGDRGPLAVKIQFAGADAQLMDTGVPTSIARTSRSATVAASHEGGAPVQQAGDPAQGPEVWTRDDFLVEITEVMLAADVDVRTRDLVKLREALANLAVEAGWVRG